MELHVKDRFYITQLLPNTNSFAGFNTKRGILNKVGLTSKDKDKYEIKEDKEHNRIFWNVEKDKNEPLVVDFTSEEISFLKAACEKIVDAPYPDDFWTTVERIYDAASAK